MNGSKRFQPLYWGQIVEYQYKNNVAPKKAVIVSFPEGTVASGVLIHMGNDNGTFPVSLNEKSGFKIVGFGTLTGTPDFVDSGRQHMVKASSFFFGNAADKEILSSLSKSDDDDDDRPLGRRSRRVSDNALKSAAMLSLTFTPTGAFSPASGTLNTT